MTGSSESVSSPESTPHLLISTNWIGDCIMSMPALAEYRRRNPQYSLHILCRPHLVSLWAMSGLADEVHVLASGNTALFTLRNRLTSTYEKAFILPNSIRSALAAKFSGAPVRVGLPGHHRSWLLTETVTLPKDARTEHQCWESYYILGLDVPDGFQPLPQPVLSVTAPLPAVAAGLADDSAIWTGFIPCAARGPSKQWPKERFIELGRILLEEKARGIVLFGGSGDAETCQEIADALGSRAVNAAGKTNLEEWAACLARCSEVVANDSGGMHISAALGRPLVAVYGMTDPSKTGPLGSRSRVVQESKVADRDISRNSEAAVASLAAISAERIYQELLENRKQPGTGDQHE